MKVLMLGHKKDFELFGTFEKIFELEKVGSEMLFFDDGCTEKKLVKQLKNSELFLLCPENLTERAGEEKACGTSLFEAVAAGYIMSQKGKILIFARDPGNLSKIFYGEPVVDSIGKAITYFRKGKKVFDTNKSLLDARRIISDAHLSFSNRGLLEAVEYGMYNETQAFLNAGFSTETENEAGVSLLSIAVRNGDIELCRMLMSYGAALNIIARDRVTSPMMDAVAAMKTEIAELLIDAGADLNYRNRNGQSALIVAIGARMEGIAGMLIDKGADITIKDSLGMTAAGYAKLFSLTGLLEKLDNL